MKFPYGVSNFQKIITQNYYYCDRTDRIFQIENAGDYLLFIRPRRFGKSLLLSMLRNYYDVGRQADFETLFGHLAVGRNPTPLRNRYLILQWDFSCVDPTGSASDIRRALYNHVNACIYNFYKEYKSFLKKAPIDSEDAVTSLKPLLGTVREAGHPLYLLIDEYDNFANEVMMSIRDERDVYKALVHEKGPVKTLFKAVKSASGEGGIDRIFITGVSPVVMSDITSGFNIAKNIYLHAEFNDICGFKESEVKEIIDHLSVGCAGDIVETACEAMLLMRTYYNGYTFAPGLDQRIYNPTMALYFAEIFAEGCRTPRKMLDANLSTDEAKLAYISQIPLGRQMLLDITREQELITVSDIADRFGIQEMLNEQGRDYAFLASFLYYFGVLTLAGEHPDGKLELRVPNLVMRGLYVDRIQRMLLPEPRERDEGKRAAESLYTRGDMGPLAAFIENRFFRVFHNPDYKWANELTVKTAFLTLLYNDILYIMDSERQTGRGYADLTMIIRPDMRRFEILDVLIEFKYVRLSNAGMTAEKARNLHQEELTAVPVMTAQMENARKQATRYGDDLEKKYKHLRLRRYAVVALGFERLWWEEIGRPDSSPSDVPTT